LETIFFDFEEIECSDWFSKTRSTKSNKSFSLCQVGNMVRHIFFNPQKHDVAEITESEAQNNIMFNGTFRCVSYMWKI